MKVVVYTQIRENYGAHDWDGEGECPQYWKFKGGNTYVTHDVTVAQGQSSEWWDALYAAVQHSSESFEEYIISADLVDECDYDESKVCEEWDSPINLAIVGDRGLATRYAKRDTFWNHDVEAKLEQWELVNGKQEGYVLMYELADGRTLTYREYMAEQEAA